MRQKITLGYDDYFAREWWFGTGSIYFVGEFGVRSEVNVYVTEREAIITGTPMQTEIVSIVP